jgi:hypothetical protein
MCDNGNVNVLYCASLASHLENFHMPYIRWLDENDCNVTALIGDIKEVMGIGKPTVSAFPAFPLPRTVRATFIAHGAPTSLDCSCSYF